MHRHLVAVHRDFAEEAVFKRACEDRLRLYENILGHPLPAPGEAAKRLEAIGQRGLLPVLTPEGHYLCQWCNVQDQRFTTRDALLQHVSSVHPEQDLDEIEKKLPSLTPAQRAALKQSRLGPHVPMLGSASGPAASRGPTRRLPGVQPLPSPAKAPPKPPVRSPTRQTGISLPRYLDRSMPKEAKSAVEGSEPAETASFNLRSHSIVFGPQHFPCEVCGRVLVSELNLLQHLEGRHPELNHPSLASAQRGGGEEGGGQWTAAQLQRAETSNASLRLQPKTFAVTCDLCSSSKVYTLASALFAHLRFKHPSEDAEYHVTRMVEASRHLEKFICTVCNKAFASQDALQGHITSKHESPESPASSRGSGIFGVVNEKNKWWCNECEKGFRSGLALQGHCVSKHCLNTKSRNCPACKRVFQDVFSLEEHMKLMHPTLSIQDLGLVSGLVCQLCDRHFLEVKDLQQHLLRHHPGKSTLIKETKIVSAHRGFIDPLSKLKVPLDTSGVLLPSEKGATLGSPPLKQPSSGLENGSAKPRKVARRRQGTS